MPIIKSSEGGEHITTVIFNSEEIAALTHLLGTGKFESDAKTVLAMLALADLGYGLGLDLRAKL